MTDDLERQLSELLCDVQIPLENIAFALEQHMRRRGRDLDPETRTLLAGVRNSLNQVTQSTREMAERPSVPASSRAASGMGEHACAG